MSGKEKLGLSSMFLIYVFTDVYCVFSDVVISFKLLCAVSLNLHTYLSFYVCMLKYVIFFLPSVTTQL